jgi:hypothetical protein
MGKAWARAAVEIGFIMFLFYSNLLMGDLSRSGEKHGHSLAWAMRDVLTQENLAIGLAAAVIGFGLVELLRKHLQ